jgi:hypothetical protein
VSPCTTSAPRHAELLHTCTFVPARIASEDGRPLYQLYGFAQTNEMRLTVERSDPNAVTIERMA